MAGAVLDHATFWCHGSARRLCSAYTLHPAWRMSTTSANPFPLGSLLRPEGIRLFCCVERVQFLLAIEERCTCIGQSDDEPGFRKEPPESSSWPSSLDGSNRRCERCGHLIPAVPRSALRCSQDGLRSVVAAPCARLLRAAHSSLISGRIIAGVGRRNNPIQHVVRCEEEIEGGKDIGRILAHPFQVVPQLREQITRSLESSDSLHATRTGHSVVTQLWKPKSRRTAPVRLTFNVTCIPIVAPLVPPHECGKSLPARLQIWLPELREIACEVIASTDLNVRFVRKAAREKRHRF